MSLYLSAGPNPRMPVKDAIYQLVRESSLLFCLPKSLLHKHFVEGTLSLQESMYAHCVSIFITHFLNRLGSEYTTLRQQLDPNNGVHQQLLSKLKRRLRAETYTRNDIFKVIRDHPEVVKALYSQFALTHRIRPNVGGHSPSRSSTPSNGDRPLRKMSKSFQNLQQLEKLSSDSINDLIRKSTSNEHQFNILSGFTIFNEKLLKTNFYQPTKSALSFRFDPSFLPIEEYPQPLYAMFLVVGSEFRGFHLRFKNVARGGIRIVTSRSKEAYSINARSLFDENYALASTQQRKNKDIPEGRRYLSKVETH